MAIKAIILVGGPNKGQRFRPLTFSSPKCMFPIGGDTIITHLIESCLKLNELSEIYILGYYRYDDIFTRKDLGNMLSEARCRVDSTFKQSVSIKYLQEPAEMGTGGGLYHFRDTLKSGNPEALLVINGDVCGDFDFDLMLAQHRETAQSASKGLIAKPYITVMTTEAGRQESLNYGCIVENPENHLIEHYVEKPSTFVSNVINCGAYVCSLELLDVLEDLICRKPEYKTPSWSLRMSVYNQVTNLDSYPDYLSLEMDVLQQRATQSHCFSYRTTGSWWCQVKTAASAMYANRRYLIKFTERLQRDGGMESYLYHSRCKIIGNVYIHHKAEVHPSAVIGPNVSIMKNCSIGEGVRIRDSILLRDVTVYPHSLILNSIIGRSCRLGAWTRVEGTPSDPDPNDKFAKVQNPPLFNKEGKLNPSISVLGSVVKITTGTVILNTIVLDAKELFRSYKNEIVL